jgi:Uma2 family endonuclease
MSKAIATTDAAKAERLLTAEEFGCLADDGRLRELVRGRIVTLNMPYPRHGYYCLRIGRILGNFVEDRDLGRVVGNDAGIITERGPDTVRGADVAYYSYQIVPRGPLVDGYLDVVPELICEVLSPSDRTPQVLAKVAEYLQAGVRVVCVFQPARESVTIYVADREEVRLTADDDFTLPDLLGDFRVPVRRFFE